MHTIVACVNGCAGLNPTAYRACVEALGNLLLSIESEHTILDPAHAWPSYVQAKEALAHAQRQEG